MNPLPRLSLQLKGYSMGNLQITKLGIIKGGECEKIFRRRSKREKGATIAVNWLLNNGYIRILKGWCKVTKMPNHGMRWVIEHVGKPYGGDTEIGWHRFMQDVARPLFESGRSFRVRDLANWGAEISSLEFALAKTFKQAKITLTKPHLDSIYKQWKLEN